MVFVPKTASSAVNARLAISLPTIGQRSLKIAWRDEEKFRCSPFHANSTCQKMGHTEVQPEFVLRRGKNRLSAGIGKYEPRGRKFQLEFVETHGSHANAALHKEYKSIILIVGGPTKGPDHEVPD
ncbi:hypothetical protein [Mesorhizobium sp. YR577]|uniref:hypothetical protein n=1 Tax=Mesorhizobium sp. YR577 TaxID=1884373 RepID=UPI001114AA53|nr:hypothetical protein [Mesorhizobium sp. YR577]